LRSLILFFQRHHLFLIFLALEGTGVFLLLRNNYIQRITFAKVTSSVSGNIHEQIENWRDYINLREQNHRLQSENTKLYNMLQESFYIEDTSRIFYSDSTKKQQRYAYLPAKVKNKAVNRQFNYLTLNRGIKGGIAEEMAVTGPEGIVGIVFGVSEHFATVMPVINRNFRVSVKFKKNNHFGSLAWDGRSYRHATMNEISLHIPVSIGDTVVVSGYSDNFPEGITVGTVDRVEQKDGSFYTIDVLLATDFRKLHYVTVVDDLMKTEQTKLEQKTVESQ
jgi:rod shape-determining protein MreC